MIPGSNIPFISSPLSKMNISYASTLSGGASGSGKHVHSFQAGWTLLRLLGFPVRYAPGQLGGAHMFDTPNEKALFFIAFHCLTLTVPDFRQRRAKLLLNVNDKREAAKIRDTLLKEIKSAFGSHLPPRMLRKHTFQSQSGKL